ncbi:MAG TPA: hypothetical protein VFJ68_10260 [Casimicrobiaceae bacterium]|nr:hypothetical protein [Casimicrobiaceae bacterium]
MNACTSSCGPPFAKVELIGTQQSLRGDCDLLFRRDDRNAFACKAEATLDDGRIPERRRVTARVVDARRDRVIRDAHVHRFGSGGQHRLVDARQIEARVAKGCFDELDEARRQRLVEPWRRLERNHDQQAHRHLVARHERLGVVLVDQANQLEQPFHRRRRSRKEAGS